MKESTLIVGGLLVTSLLWLVAMYGIAWSWNRHAPIVMATGFEVKNEYQHKGLRDVARRHTPGWSGVFAVLFLAMTLSDFPLWQRLGFAFILSMIYGIHYRVPISEADISWGDGKFEVGGHVYQPIAFHDQDAGKVAGLASRRPD